MSDQATTIHSISDSVRDNWGWFLALGIVLIVGGLLSFLAPFMASVVVTIIVAIVLVVSGVFQIIHAWRMKSWSGFLWYLVIGAVMLIGGLAVYVSPVVGTFALTLTVAALFIAKGAFQIVLGWRLRPQDGWRWTMAAGVLAAIVGLIILFDFPFSGLYALGVLVGISLAITGWSYVAIALAGRRRLGEAGPGQPSAA